MFFKERVHEISRAGAGRQAQAPCGIGASRGDVGCGCRAERRRKHAPPLVGRRTGHAVTEVWLDLEATPHGP